MIKDINHKDPRVQLARALLRTDDARLEQALKGRLCLGCKHLRLAVDDWGGSAQTPPSGTMYLCNKGEFVTDVQYLRQLRLDLARAQTCPHYSPEPWA